MFMFKKLLILLIILSLSSCGRYWYKPYGRLFNTMPKGGTPGFELGWIHGCESGMATQFGGSIFMSFYSWKKDPDIIKAKQSPEDITRIRKRYMNEKLANIDWDNPAEVHKNFSDYNNIFWATHIFCRHSVLGNLQMADMAPPLPGDQRYDPSAHSLGNIYKIDGKGKSTWSHW